MNQMLASSPVRRLGEEIPPPAVMHEGKWVEVDRCPLCQQPASGSEPFEDTSAFGRRVTYWICGRCGMVYQSPRLSGAHLEHYYRAGYRHQMQGQEEPSPRDRWTQARRAEHLVHLIEKHGLHPRRHLDIGSSLGLLLAASASRFGCEVHGVEPGEAHRQASREQGIETVAALSELDPSLAHSFDLVSLIHVLEHLPDPVATLRTVRRDWMTPEAWLLVEVPSLLSHPCLEPAHLVAFTPKTLIGALEAAGFVAVGIKTHGRPYSRWLRPFVTVLARPRLGDAPWRVGRERALRLRRRMGLGVLAAARALARHLLPAERLRPWV